MDDTDDVRRVLDHENRVLSLSLVGIPVDDSLLGCLVDRQQAKLVTARQLGRPFGEPAVRLALERTVLRRGDFGRASLAQRKVQENTTSAKMDLKRDSGAHGKESVTRVRCDRQDD